MLMEAHGEGLTRLLHQWRDGNSAAFDDLVPEVYKQLSLIGRRLMRGERAGCTLQTAGLVHEAYLRLLGLSKIDWQDRSHFFAVAAGTMRRILVDQARAKKADKRGGDAVHVTLSDEQCGCDGASESVDVVALDDALYRLSKRDAQQGQIVELRYFGGLSVDEVAQALGISAATVKRKWTLARAWLYRSLQADLS